MFVWQYSTYFNLSTTQSWTDTRSIFKDHQKCCIRLVVARCAYASCAWRVMFYGGKCGGGYSYGGVDIGFCAHCSVNAIPQLPSPLERKNRRVAPSFLPGQTLLSDGGFTKITKKVEITTSNRRTLTGLDLLPQPRPKKLLQGIWWQVFRELVGVHHSSATGELKIAF